MASPCETSARPRKHRVLFLFAHLHKGGMQKAVSNISCALPPEIEQYVAYFGTENPGFPYKGRLVDLTIPGGMHGGIARKAWNFASRIWRLQGLIDREGIDTVVSFGEAANMLNILTRRKRTVLSVRVSLAESLGGTGINRLYGNVYRLVIRHLYKRAHGIVAVSSGIAGDLATRFAIPAGKIAVITNGYDRGQIIALSAEPLEHEIEPIFAHPVVINVGSLTFQKGQEHLLRSFALARRAIPGLQLVILGEGPLRGRLDDLVLELGLAGLVHFLGFRLNPFKYVARSRMFVFTSLFEGFPNALVEAMVCGVPVVATDCPTGPREIVGDSEFGILVPMNPGANRAEMEARIAEGMVRLSEADCHAHYREMARSRSEAFDIRSAADKWRSVIAP